LILFLYDNPEDRTQPSKIEATHRQMLSAAKNEVEETCMNPLPRKDLPVFFQQFAL